MVYLLVFLVCGDWRVTQLWYQCAGLDFVSLPAFRLFTPAHHPVRVGPPHHSAEHSSTSTQSVSLSPPTSPPTSSYSLDRGKKTKVSYTVSQLEYMKRTWVSCIQWSVKWSINGYIIKYKKEIINNQPIYLMRLLIF